MEYLTVNGAPTVSCCEVYTREENVTNVSKKGTTTTTGTNLGRYKACLAGVLIRDKIHALSAAHRDKSVGVGQKQRAFSSRCACTPGVSSSFGVCKGRTRPRERHGRSI